MPESPSNEIHSWLRLTLPRGVSFAGQRCLLAQFGTAQAVLDADPGSVARVAGQDAADAIARGPDPALMARTLQWLRQPGHHLLVIGREPYPALLSNIADPPAVLYAMGRIELLAAPALAIVGSRNATPQGVRDASAFATAMSQAGLCVVSGLALGIDAAAHRGGLSAAGSTIAVLGTGADLVYPSRNRSLAREIAQAGCVVTEFPLGTRSFAGNFPRRNRLISGLSRGVLVVEAAVPSGSLITARMALEQGRDVFAVPGSIHSPLSRGCHGLIKDGAKLVECADDILSELGIVRETPRAAPARCGAPVDPLLAAMGFAPVSLDQMAQCCGLDIASLCARLSRLEVDGRVSALPGGRFQRIAGPAGSPDIE